MKNLLLASAAVMGLALSVPAMAQQASNITPSDTRSDIAPALPTPPVSPDAGPRQYLQAARTALSAHRTGEAQEALERAEARLLDRSTANPGREDRAPMVRQVADAREALGRGDVTGATRIVDAALAGGPARVAPQASAAPMTAPSPGMAMAAGATGGAPSAIAGMPASGVTVYDNHEVPLPSTDDSMTFRNRNGDNSFTVRATGEHNADDVGPGADSAN
jgi:hypothetical protein